jgi:DNA-binding GntR family transcriptional regulator
MAEPLITIKSLKEHVYEYLREELRTGKILPGAVINLEMEGFVTIQARRNVVVNSLSLQDIQNFYEVIGALESTALSQAFSKIGSAEIKTMENLIEGMKDALRTDDFDRYYDKNLALHDVYLSLCGNERLVRIVNTMKKRLYDFPRKHGFVKEWEQASISEHTELLDLIRQKKACEAAAYIRDVHWSFKVQRKYIVVYYQGAPSPAEIRTED